jgi:acyl-CoA synthetase (AMP-forming)/AMP-acid ligase II/aryl carrier-like protein
MRTTMVETLSEVLEQAAESDRAITLIEGGERSELALATLRARALALLGRLQAAGMRAGDELVLHVPGNAPFLEGFWAGVLGGIVPVPVALGAGDEHRRKLLRILTLLERPRLWTDALTLERLKAFLNEQGKGDRIAALEACAILVEQSPLDGPLEGPPGEACERAPDDLAFVQFTSGSVSEPRGVMLTHRNLVTNVRAIIAAARIEPDDRSLSWMPLTHDMGLIGFHLTPLVRGCQHALMPTELFVRRPLAWLQRASELGATVLCSPNFGYQHFLRALERTDPGPLDLSRVRLIFNGAEPISTGLCAEFLERMQVFGLRASAMFPVYGLAEASVAVSFSVAGAGLEVAHVDRARLSLGDRVRPLAAEDPAAVPFAILGSAVPDCELRITDDAGAGVPDEVVGHVEIRGANVSAGYYHDEEATRAIRRADGWLDTGDLGFVGASGLVVTGREKEVIFANGQNFYPQDVEALIQRETGLEAGKVAAVGMRRPDAVADDLLVFLVHKGELGPLAPTAAALTAALNAQLGLDVTRVVPLSRLPKTTSGKVQRRALARSFAAGEYEREARELAAQVAALGAKATTSAADAAHASIEETLRAICQRVLVDREVGREDNLFEIGTSSVELAQIHEEIETAFPGVLDITDLFDYPTLAALAKLLDERT